MSAVVKTCACGRSYTHEEWCDLPQIGVSDYGGTSPPMDHRNCLGCSSTMAREVDDGASVCGRCGSWTRNTKIAPEEGPVLCERCALIHYHVDGRELHNPRDPQLVDRFLRRSMRAA